MDSYPDWFWYPSTSAPPLWVEQVIEVFQRSQPAIDSTKIQGLKSDGVLAELAGGLEEVGFKVEKGKRKEEKILRPVLFGKQGAPRVTYEVDGVHDELGIILEIEAGRGWMGNAFYRDLVRTSLIVGAEYLMLGLMNEYRYKSGGSEMKNRSYDQARDQLDAIYASGRLHLPFKGILLIGY
jgi:hypothetical protein